MSSSKRRPDCPRHYDVGYGKPPKKHRFRKGQSGNARGRPKGILAFGNPASLTEH